MASGRGRGRQLRLWAAFAAGCVAGGALTALALAVLSGLVSPVPAPVRVAVLLAAVAGLVCYELLADRVELPQRRRLIPQEVFAGGLAPGIARFGVEYGTGVRTLVPSAAPYVLAAFLLAANLPAAACVAVGAGFGTGRSLAALAVVVRGGPGWQQALLARTRLLERAGTVVTAGLLVAAVASASGA